MRDWVITARKLITQKSPNTKLYRQTMLYICTYIDQLAVNNCQLQARQTQQNSGGFAEDQPRFDKAGVAIFFLLFTR